MFNLVTGSRLNTATGINKTIPIEKKTKTAEYFSAVIFFIPSFRL